MTKTRLFAGFTLAAAAIAGTLVWAVPAHAQSPTAGAVIVFNQSGQPIHPWFKCPAPACNADGSWTFYGGIGPYSSFGWDFSAFPGDFAFTYTLDGDPPPADSVKGDRKAIFSVDPTTNIVIQIGNKVRAFDLNAPDENGKSAK